MANPFQFRPITCQELDMADKLRLGLKQIRNLVLMTVIEQPERMRNTQLAASVTIRSNSTDPREMTICSAGSPGLFNNVINIRGTDQTADHRVYSRSFDTPKEAGCYLERIRLSVVRLNQAQEQGDCPDDLQGLLEVVE